MFIPPSCSPWGYLLCFFWILALFVPLVLLLLYKLLTLLGFLIARACLRRLLTCPEECSSRSPGDYQPTLWHRPLGWGWGTLPYSPRSTGPGTAPGQLSGLVWEEDCQTTATSCHLWLWWHSRTSQHASCHVKAWPSGQPSAQGNERERERHSF